MDYFHEQLPSEIIQLILAHLTYDAKIKLRATNNYYRNKIQMTHFNFYFTRASTIPAIVDHMLAKYGSVPIGMHFKKSIHRGLSQYADHIWKLSNLTALSFDFPYDANYVWNLTRLTNLIDFDNNYANLKFFKLRSIYLNLYSNEDLQQMPNIEKIIFIRSNYQPRKTEPYGFIPHPERVTHIVLKHEQQASVADLTRFTNLHSLHFGDTNYNAHNLMAFSTLTSIRDLTLDGPNYYGCCAMTRLTALCVRHVTEEISQLSALRGLKELTLEPFNSTRNTPFELDLTPLTALHTLHCHYYALSRRPLLDAVTLPHLTALELPLTLVNHVAHVTGLHRSLKVLYLQEIELHAVHVDYHVLSHLTNLVSLQLGLCTTRPSLAAVSELTNLTKLEVTRHSSGPNTDWSFSKLTNLEVLDVGAIHATSLNALSHVTKLTYLDIRFTTRQLGQHSTCFAALVNLRTLAVHSETNDLLFWQVLTELTNLEALQLCKVDSDAYIGSLTALSKLTRLVVRESSTLSGTYLHRLTTLQVLTFASQHARAAGFKKKGLRKFAAKMPHLYSYSFY